MGAEIDSLSIGISASSKQAISAIDNLVVKLEQLGQTFSNLSGAGLSSGLGSSVSTIQDLSTAINGINPSHIKDMSSAFRSLGTASKNLSSVNEGAFNNLVYGLETLSAVRIGDFSNISLLAEGVNKLGYQSAVTASQILPQISEGLRSFAGINLPTFENMEGFSMGLRSLGSKAVSNAAYSLPFIADGLRQFANINIPNLEGLDTLAKTLSAFGRKTAQQAITTIPQLAKSFDQLFRSMSKAPRVSQNTIDAANAFANLATKAGSAGTALTRATPKLNLWSASAGKATKTTFSLASAIGKVYATYWMLFRAFGVIKDTINIASDLEEVKNVVYHAFDDMAWKANEFAETVGEKFGMSKLDALDFASRYQAMGRTMGVTNDMVITANDKLRTSLKDTLDIDYVRDAYGDLGNTAADMSLNLTRLAGDLASLYNTDVTDAAEKLDSIFTGTVKPLRQFGFDLTQANLQEWALTNGINANVKAMTQAEKAVLRYQYVMANADFVMGDFVRTSDSWHNSIVRLKLAFKNLGSVIGQGFINLLKPVVRKFTAFINTITGLVQKAINAIGKLLGWQMQIDPVAPLDDSYGGAGDMADAMEDAEDASGGTADNLKKGADAAKKMKNYLLGIDELNVFNPNEDSSSSPGKSGGSGGGAGGGGKGGAKGGDVKFVPYESDIDSWWELGNTIANKIGEALWNIDWNSIKAQAATFAKNLADFLNGFIDSDIFWTGVGHTIAEAINTALVFAETFIDNLKWGKLGQQIGNLINQAVSDFEWDRLGRTIAKGINAAVDFMLNLGQTIDVTQLGEGIATAINNFFETFDAAKFAKTLNVWVDNLEELIKSTITNIDWSTVWDDVVAFFDTIELDTLTVIIGAITWKFASKSVIEYAKKALLLKLGTLAKGFTIKKLALSVMSFTLKFQGTPSFDSIIAPIVEKFDKEFSAHFPSLSEFIGKALAGATVGGGTGAWIGMLGGPIGAAAGAIVGALVGALSSDVFQPFREAVVKNIFNFDFATGLFDEMTSHFQKAINSEDFGEVGIEIIEGIATGIAGALSFLVEPIADLFQWTFDEICSVFGISSPAKKMIPIGENIMLGIIGGIKAKFTEIATVFSEWFDNHVKPWFTLKRWEELASNIKSGIVNKWNEFTLEWIPKITNWWDTHVKPWFSLDKWKTEAGHIKDAIKSKWDEMVTRWKTDISTWWNTHVQPWFKLDKWKTEAGHIKTAIISKWDEFVTNWKTKISNWWNNDVKKWFSVDTWKKLGQDAVDGIKKGFDSKVDEFREYLKGWWDKFKGLFTVEPSKGDSSGSGSTKKAAGGVYSAGRWHNIHAYASGGIPDEGQLFYARESGPELVSTIGGNTAVMNNDQIVASVANGVQMAVTNALSSYLNEIERNTRITANKELTVNIGDRQIAESNNRGQAKLGAVLLT